MLSCSAVCGEVFEGIFDVTRDRLSKKTHDVGELLLLIPEGTRPYLTAEEQRRLTSYATVTRYPGDYEPIPLVETRRAVAIARRVRKELRKYLPLEILRKRRKS